MLTLRQQRLSTGPDVGLRSASPVPRAGPLTAFARFVANYFRFSGRASRSEYWWTFGGLVGLGLAATVPKALSARRQQREAERRRDAGEDVVYDAEIGAVISRERLEATRHDRQAHWELGRDVARSRSWSQRILLNLDNVVLFSCALGLVSMQSRRLHDAGYSGRWQLLEFVPFVGTISNTYRCLKPSTSEGRRFDLPRKDR